MCVCVCVCVCAYSSSRLYVRGLFLGYKRSKANQHTNTALLKLEHVECTKDATWYLGKRVAYVYKAKTEKQGSKFRCIWGKVSACVTNCSACFPYTHNDPSCSSVAIDRLTHSLFLRMCIIHGRHVNGHAQVVRPHGTSGVVRAKFQKNLPPAAMVRTSSASSWMDTMHAHIELLLIAHEHASLAHGV